ncbi:MAG TPA: FAD-dependent oxidoreductase, partial [Longimicrobiales bacterium]|nr:FAD-dependent oxidoreductase [Longimicrobiales bacterium]
MAEIAHDVAVVGAGPAGIAATVLAAAAGRSVVVLDEARTPGGQVWRPGSGGAPGRQARRWLRRLRESGAGMMGGTTVVDLARDGDGHVILAERDDTPVVIRAGTLILATGARERLLPFPGWTLPGVVAAGGAQALVRAGWRVHGRRVVVAGTGPLLLAAAAALARAGARVLEVAEQADAGSIRRFAAGLWSSPGRILQAAAYRAVLGRTRHTAGTWVVRAEAGSDGALVAVVLTDGRRERVVPCDLLCTGYSLVPATELARLAGCRMDGHAAVVDEHARTTVPGVLCAGEGTGVKGVAGAIVEGTIAGTVAAGGKPGAALLRARARETAFGRRLEGAFALRPGLRERVRPDTIVCRCEDVRFGALAGHGSLREAKLATRLGMGPCQGRVCGAAAEFLLGWSGDTVRPP